MRSVTRVAVIVGLLVAVGAIFYLKRGNVGAGADATAQPAPVAAAAAPLPRLLDLGATQCIPCKMMAPILDEMKRDYAGKMQVDFIDVWKDEAAPRQYKIDAIPTQIFFDASGKELARHQGFISKADILAQWKQLGFAFTREDR